MLRAVDLSILGALALIGGGAGLHLGWSAIGEINPIHFETSPSGSTFHADLSPNRSFDSAEAAPRAEQVDQLALGSGCIGCGAYPVDARPVQDPAIEQAYAASPADDISLPVQPAAYEEEAPEETARRKADLERVELYSRAPISVEEAVVETPAVEETAPVS
jgi:hypothetical protein